MTQHIISSSVPCRCCESFRNGMFVHGPCKTTGELIKGMYQVSCTDCRASGPLCDSPAKALRGWELMMAENSQELAADAQEEVFKKAI